VKESERFGSFDWEMHLQGEGRAEDSVLLVSRRRDTDYRSNDEKDAAKEVPSQGASFVV
jgi:hypothetical protein